MVKQVENSELEKEYGTTAGRIMQFRLTHTEVEEWKQNGNFKHLKKELENIPNIEFSCSKTPTECMYTFKTHSRRLTTRLIFFIHSLLNSKKTKLMSNSPEERTFFRSSDWWNGKATTCPLW